MTRPLQKLADELLSSEMEIYSSEMGRYHEVVRAADAVLHILTTPDWCPLCTGLEEDGIHGAGCNMRIYQRAVEEWEKMNAARLDRQITKDEETNP